MTRILRLFAYGLLSVIFVLFLVQMGLTKNQIGILFTGTLIGDALLSLLMTTTADQLGRKQMLMSGAGLMMLAGVVFTLTNNFIFLLAAATIGVISPSGYEIGPFLAIEQATLAHLIPDGLRTKIFAWYHLAGFCSTAVGALLSGWSVYYLQHLGMTLAQSYRSIIIVYAMVGFILCVLFSKLSPAVEMTQERKFKNLSGLFVKNFGLHHSRAIVLRLSFLFALDSFAGAFILNSIVAYWFHIRFHVDVNVLGNIFFGVSLLSGLSGLAAARLSSRIGLINTMVFTHIPSNILLICIPLMPNLQWAMIVFLLRCSISQMDVPTRQSYTMAVVSPEERSAAGGITNIARTIGAALAPMFTSMLLGSASLLSISFFLAGGLKIVYDVLVYRGFRSIRPPEEDRQ